MNQIKRLSSLFYNSNNLKQAVGILFVTVLISNILGLIRNVVIANRVGVTYGSIGSLDNYYAAFVLPDLLYNIIIVGALSAVILPLLVKIGSEGDGQKFWRTFNVLLSTSLTVIIIGLSILYFLLPHLVPRLFPGFSEENLELTTQLSQVLLLSPLFFTVSQFSTAALQAKKYFFAPALAPIIYNAAIISAALLIPDYGLSVLVFGVLIGAAGHFLIQLPSLLRLGWSFRFELGFGNEHVKKVVLLMIPRTVALTGTQLLLLAFYSMASSLKDGSIAIYRLTDDLQTAPVLLIANTLAVAVLPDFARHISTRNQQEFVELVGKTIRFLLYVFLPLTVFLLVFREQIITLYVALGRSISADETALAVKTFSFFVVSIFFQGSISVLARAYFAKADTVRPTIFSVASIAVALGSAWLLVKFTGLGVAGLSLAFSFGSLINALLLWINLRLSPNIIWRDFEGKVNLPKVILATLLLMGLFILIDYLSTPLTSKLITESFAVRNFCIVIFAALSGILAYISLSRVFDLEQWDLIKPKRISTKT